MKSNQRGYTLTEMMVVVAIIGILAMIGLRLSWRRDDGRAFARSVQMSVFNARRQALAMGVLRYLTGPAQPPDTPRASCMPNVRLRILSDRVEQYECQLNESAIPPNVYPCTPTPTEDCTWLGPIRTFTAPGGIAIDLVQTRVDGPGVPGSWGPAALPLNFHFRPDGSTDTTYGVPNESARIFIKNVNLSSTTCSSESSRCYLVMSHTSKIATRWPVLP